MSQDELRILHGYSSEMLSNAISELSASVLIERAGAWERQRLEELLEERSRREAARIPSESTNQHAA